MQNFQIEELGYAAQVDFHYKERKAFGTQAAPIDIMSFSAARGHPDARCADEDGRHGAEEVVGSRSEHDADYIDVLAGLYPVTRYICFAQFSRKLCHSDQYSPHHVPGLHPGFSLAPYQPSSSILAGT